MSKVEEEIQKAMREFHTEILQSVEQKVRSYASSLRDMAVIGREEAIGKHNFTGNLLNSIVVCVYKDGNPDVAYFASGIVKGAIQAKMTKSHGPYGFKVDYEGGPSLYRIEGEFAVPPEVETNHGYGAKDAQDFFAEYRPSRGEKYTIVLAYTAEYASFVESARHTTGFLEAYTWADKTAFWSLGLERVYSRPSYSVLEASF